MGDTKKAKRQYADELEILRIRMAELERVRAERQRTEEELQASETRYRRLFETARDGILILDADTGQIDAANPFLMELLGYSQEELLGKTLWEIGPFKNVAESRAAFLELQTQGYARYEDLPLETSDGRLIDVEFVSNVYLVNDARVIQCNIRDITARKRAENALHLAYRELQARNDELDAFGYTVAHDLKNPLGVILGYADILADRDYPLSEEDVRKIGPPLFEMCLKMDSIVDGLMLLSGLYKAEVKMESLDMASIVAEVQKRLTYMIEDACAEIVEPTGWPDAVGYTPWVEEVWINYISNAVKYGGRPPHIELGATQQEKSVRFWVRDDGSGLTPDEQSRLFAPFERLNQARIAGHGLGLSIVRRIVEKMGGQVSVESAGVAGEGSTFIFTLPVV